MREGDFRIDGAQVSKVEIGKTSKGNVQMAITFKTNDADYPVMVLYRFFSDAAIPYTEADLRTLGWDPLENKWAIDDMIESGALIGAEADLVCAMEDYNGQRRAKIKFVNEAGGGGMRDKMEASEAKAFANGIRSRLGMVGPKAKAPTKKTPF